MAITRVTTVPMSGQNLAVPTSDIAIGSYSGPPLGSIDVGDNQFIIQSEVRSVSTVGPPGGNVNISDPGPDWEQVAFAPRDFSTGAETFIRLIRVWWHVADGSAADTPTITARATATAGNPKAYVHGTMVIYRGQKLAFHSAGWASSPTITGPTDPFFTEALPSDSIMVGAAYMEGNTPPSLYASNGFTRWYAQDPPGSTFRPSLSIADLYPVSGTTAGPQWTVSRGSSITEPHDLWFVMKKAAEIVPGLRLSGLTVGRRRKRLGQPQETS
jgi:hypothetical protein